MRGAAYIHIGERRTVVAGIWTGRIEKEYRKLRASSIEKKYNLILQPCEAVEAR